jgi:tRNA1(Val) A37 N6-methylase TrmN6
MMDVDTSDDRFLDGRLVLAQPRRGYRAGMDAALLAAACDTEKGHVIEAGCGCGAALLSAAARWPTTRFLGVESDPLMLSLAERNIVRNGLGERVRAVAGDVAGGFAALSIQPFDAAMANPPYFTDPTALRAPKGAKRAAFVAEQGIAAWVDFLLDAVRPGGVVTVIHRPEALAQLIAALTARAGGIQIRPIHPFADAPAKRILVRGRKAGRGPMRLLAPVFLHDRQGAKHTAETEALLRGASRLSWMR